MATINFGLDNGTFFASFEAADKIARDLGGYAADVDDWSYVVVPAGEYFKVEIIDEDEFHVAFYQSIGPHTGSWIPVT